MPDLGPRPVRMTVDADMVRSLVDEQFPDWSHLPVTPVPQGGWDNWTFHLGDSMLVRLPSAAEYALAVEKERRWLPELARRLPLPIPSVRGSGVPSGDYPYSWSIYGWLDGDRSSVDRIADPMQFALDLAAFVSALRAVDATDGPRPGIHNWFRGATLRTYDESTQGSLVELDGTLDVALAAEIWTTALSSQWDGVDVWFHGDLAEGNLLVDDGRLAAVIDFGTCGVGDPSCDLAIAWTMLDDPGRHAFRDRLGIADATWARGRGWALWKSLSRYAGALEDDVDDAAEARRVLDEIFAEYTQSAESHRAALVDPDRRTTATSRGVLLSASNERPLIGVEAQRIFLELRDHRAAFDLARDVVTLTHALHVGPAASEVVNQSMARLRECDTVEEVDEVFAAARASWSGAGLGALLTTDKDGAWNRSAVVSGLSSATGHLVDVGNANNGFGDYLLRTNTVLEEVTGVDHRRDPKVLTGERLHFAHMNDEAILPLADDVADVVAFRASLHHMNKPVQEALIAEAARVVKPGGEILLVEDSWADRPGLTDNALTMRFAALDHADKIATLSMIDVSSCLMYHETVAYPLSYRSSAEWSQLLVEQGATSVDVTHWGFNMFTIYAGPMCVIRATIG